MEDRYGRRYLPKGRYGGGAKGGPAALDYPVLMIRCPNHCRAIAAFARFNWCTCGYAAGGWRTSPAGWPGRACLLSAQRVGMADDVMLGCGARSGGLAVVSNHDVKGSGSRR